MEKLFENQDFILSSTGHDYDFVGIIETKGDKPLTFYFSEELVTKSVRMEIGLMRDLETVKSMQASAENQRLGNVKI